MRDDVGIFSGKAEERTRGAALFRSTSGVAPDCRTFSQRVKGGVFLPFWRFSSADLIRDLKGTWQTSGPFRGTITPKTDHFL
jgi:hypothetical protein